MCQRRQVSACSTDPRAGTTGWIPRIQQRQQHLDHGRLHAAEALGEHVRPQQQHRAHFRLGQGIAHAARMAPHQVALQRLHLARFDASHRTACRSRCSRRRPSRRVPAVHRRRRATRGCAATPPDRAPRRADPRRPGRFHREKEADQKAKAGMTSPKSRVQAGGFSVQRSPTHPLRSPAKPPQAPSPATPSPHTRRCTGSKESAEQKRGESRSGPPAIPAAPE